MGISRAIRMKGFSSLGHSPMRDALRPWLPGQGLWSASPGIRADHLCVGGDKPRNVPIADHFFFTPLSLAASCLIGFLIALIVVHITTWRITGLNIVRAVRNIPEPPLARGDRRSRLAGRSILLGGQP